MRWEHFAHGADLGVRGRGQTLEEAFAAAALAVTAAVTDPAVVRPVDTVEFDCPGTEPELLLYDFLNALIFTMATRRSLYGACEVRIDAAGVHARLHGEPVDRARHTPAVEPKGATLTCLRVARAPDGEWRAECVIDI
jgi:SHS2 domain-containing protein